MAYQQGFLKHLYTQAPESIMKSVHWNIAVEQAKSAAGNMSEAELTELIDEALIGGYALMRFILDTNPARRADFTAQPA